MRQLERDGVSDLVVVKSGNAILVIRKDQAQDVRKVVDALSAKEGFYFFVIGFRSAST